MQIFYNKRRSVCAYDIAGKVSVSTIRYNTNKNNKKLKDEKDNANCASPLFEKKKIFNEFSKLITLVILRLFSYFYGLSTSSECVQYDTKNNIFLDHK